jgi:hypothetical protein
LLRKTLGFGFAAVMPFVAGAVLLTSRPVTVSLPADIREAVDAPMTPADVDQEEDLTDLLGNTVSDAVARYKFDATGSLYELHSPQTEVPHLRPPKT